MPYFSDDDLNDEFNLIVDQLKTFTLSSLGKSMTQDLAILNNFDVKDYLENKEVLPVSADNGFNIKIDNSLLSRIFSPRSHRKGIVGKMANFILSKLFLVQKTFLNSVLLHQESLNEVFLENINQLLQKVEKLESNEIYSKDVVKDLELKLVNRDERLIELEAKLNANEDWLKESSRETRGNSDWLKKVEVFMKYLEKSIAMAKKDFYFELRKNTNPISFKSEIIDKSKIEMIPLRLNLGCGQKVRDEYVNVDSRRLDGVAVIAKVDDLPFSSNSVDEILSEHLVEHFEEIFLVKKLFPYWMSLLKNGGRLEIVVPDHEFLIKKYVEDGEMPWSFLKESILGGQDYEGDYHYYLVKAEEIKNILEVVGFRDISISKEGLKAFEVSISAIK